MDTYEPGSEVLGVGPTLHKELAIYPKNALPNEPEMRQF